MPWAQPNKKERKGKKEGKEKEKETDAVKSGGKLPRWEEDKLHQVEGTHPKLVHVAIQETSPV